MKPFLALFGMLLLVVGLLAVIVAVINTDEWEGEKNARAQANLVSGASALAQSDHENTAFLNLWAGGADKQFHRLHDQRMNVLAISTVGGVASLLGGTALLIAGVTSTRKIKIKTSVLPPKLQTDLK